jgi:hypothetical protein
LLYAKMVVNHVVCLRFRESASAAEIADIVAGFRALAHVEALRCTSFEGGVNSSAEGLSAPFGAPSAGAGATHIFLLKFATAEDVSAYRLHDAHTAFVAKLRPLLAADGGVFVADFKPEF